MTRSTLSTLLALGAALALSLPFAGREGPGGGGAAAYKVVVNAAHPSSGETKSALSKLFLKKVREWGDKTEGQPPTTWTRNRMPARPSATTSTGKSVSAIKSYWQRMIFSGRDVPPDEISSESDLLKKVAADKGAIGYVSAKTPLPDGVKELKVKDE